MTSRFMRLSESHRATVTFTVDGQVAAALEGDTLLTAMLTTGAHLRQSEFGGERRAGFCLMGACQDCWVWAADGTRLRACGTSVSQGMAIVTERPGYA